MKSTTIRNGVKIMKNLNEKIADEIQKLIGKDHQKLVIDLPEMIQKSIGIDNYSLVRDALDDCHSFLDTHEYDLCDHILIEILEELRSL